MEDNYNFELFEADKLKQAVNDENSETQNNFHDETEAETAKEKKKQRQ